MSDPLFPTKPSTTGKRYTKDQRLYLAFFFTSCTYSTMIFTMQGPLFPPEARLKGVSSSVYGVILATPSAVSIISAFLAARLEKFGLLKSYALSTFISALGPLILGLLHFVDSYPAFVALSFVALILFGAGYSATVSTVYVICLHVFPEATSTAIGITVAGFASGTCFGPTIAELIRTGLGYTGTYLLYGVIQIIVALLIWTRLPVVPQHAEEGDQLTFMEMMRGYGQILKFPSIIIFALNIASLEMGKDFLTTILEEGLQPFHLTHIGVGLMFLCGGGFQLLSPLWGILLDKTNTPELMLISSHVVLAISFLLVGPVSFISTERSYGLTVFSLLFYGFGQGILDVTAITSFQLRVKEVRGSESAAIDFSFVAFSYNVMLGFGGLAGPAIAGAMLESYGFGNAFMFTFITNLTLGVILIVYMIQKKCRPTQGREYESLI